MAPAIGVEFRNIIIVNIFSTGSDKFIVLGLGVFWYMGREDLFSSFGYGCWPLQRVGPIPGRHSRQWNVCRRFGRYLVQGPIARI